ncbi:MAG: alanyl-tRNA editing protein [Chloroflexota bacterium]
MNNRLYYQNSYLTSFDTTIHTRLTVQNSPAVILQQSAFYPTSGGQPHDLGYLNDVSVTDVFIDKDTDQVVHILEQEIRGDEVTARVNWSRRFDLMQQHSGQHILSQAIIRQVDAETIGFHLSQDYATLDIARNDIAETDLVAAENLANQILYENRSVTARFVTNEELVKLPLRKQPSVKGAIRVVTIEDFDWSACGGTHVAHTGEVGIIKIIKRERRKKGLRLTFLCGKRALTHYQQINSHIREMALQLDVSIEEALEALTRQQAQLKQANKENERLQAQQLQQRAQSLAEQALQVGAISVVSFVAKDEPIATIQQLAKHITQNEATIALLGIEGQKGQLVFARSKDVSLDMRMLLKSVGPIIGGGGGGSPELAQGGGSNPEKVTDAVTEAVNLVRIGQ